MARPWPYRDRMIPMSFGLSPCATCVLSASRKCACPPSWVMPASNALRVRVDLSRNSMNSVLSGSRRCGSPCLNFAFSSHDDGDRLVDLLGRPVERLDVVPARERRPVHRHLRAIMTFLSSAPAARRRARGTRDRPAATGRRDSAPGPPSPRAGAGRPGRRACTGARFSSRPVASRIAATTAAVATMVAARRCPWPRRARRARAPRRTPRRSAARRGSWGSGSP